MMVADSDSDMEEAAGGNKEGGGDGGEESNKKYLQAPEAPKQVRIGKCVVERPEGRREEDVFFGV